ncbi:MAG: DNA polymerase IV [Coriobacteriales bacterium]
MSEWNMSSTDDGELEPWHGKAILLVDLDAFFASVEQLDHPEWRGKPVIVGGSAEKRGVVSTASYEARKYGVHSAMPSWRAKKLCPDAIWTFGNYPRYSEMSRKVMSFITDETPLVQQVSIDEAFADVTPGKHLGDHPVIIARRIKDRVRELGITCSVGVGTTKTIAKIASDLDKPDGLTVVFPGREQEFLNPLPVGKISGIGGKSQEKLSMFGIETIGQLADADEKLLRSIFGINAPVMIQRARGEEASEVSTEREVKSVSNEQTFAQDLDDREQILAALDMVCGKVGRRLRRKELAGYTVTVKVRYRDLSIHTAQKTGRHPIDDERQMMPIVHELLDKVWRPGIGLRLVGVGVSEFEGRPEQLSLFPEEDDEEEELPPDSGNLAKATDAVKNRFGEKAVRYGRELRFEGRDTGTMAQNKDLADLQSTAIKKKLEHQGENSDTPDESDENEEYFESQDDWGA